MAGFFNALSACFVLLMIMSVGYLMGRLGWMTQREKSFVSKYIVNIAVPCNCVVGLLDNLDREGIVQAAGMMAAGVASVILTVLASATVATLLRLPHERWGVFVAMAGFSNTLFIGIPVCTQLFGDVSMPYIMLYYIGHTSLMQSIGMMLLERAGSKAGQKGSFLQFCKDVFLKPPILSVAFSIVLLALGWKLPPVLMRFADYISGSVSPLALIYCGFIVYEVGLKNLRLLPGLPAMLAIRLVLAPVICWGSCVLFGVTGLARDVFIVESALPVVSQVTVMAGAYGADEQYAASGACLSILVSFVTIPVLMLLIG